TARQAAGGAPLVVGGGPAVPEEVPCGSGSGSSRSGTGAVVRPVEGAAAEADGDAVAEGSVAGPGGGDRPGPAAGRRFSSARATLPSPDPPNGISEAASASRETRTAAASRLLRATRGRPPSGSSAVPAAGAGRAVPRRTSAARRRRSR